MIRIAPQLALAALLAASTASADPIPECTLSDAATKPVATIQLASDVEPTDTEASSAALPATLPATADASTSAEGASSSNGQSVPSSSAKRLQAWARNVRGMLSLREFIQTTPFVVGGMKLYLEAEPVAVMQRPQSASQLIFAVGSDKVVLRGAF